jgi:hypothetical protein
MSDANHAINIDVPVELKSVKSVHSIGSLQFEGDLPAAIFHLQLITNDIADWGADSEVIVVFHTNADTSLCMTRRTTPHGRSQREIPTRI